MSSSLSLSLSYFRVKGATNVYEIYCHQQTIVAADNFNLK